MSRSDKRKKFESLLPNRPETIPHKSEVIDDLLGIQQSKTSADVDHNPTTPTPESAVETDKPLSQSENVIEKSVPTAESEQALNHPLDIEESSLEIQLTKPLQTSEVKDGFPVIETPEKNEGGKNHAPSLESYSVEMTDPNSDVTMRMDQGMDLAVSDGDSLVTQQESSSDRKSIPKSQVTSSSRQRKRTKFDIAAAIEDYEAEKQSKPKYEDIYTKVTIPIRKDLVARLNEVAKRHSHGFKSRLFNTMLESALDQLESEE